MAQADADRPDGVSDAGWALRQVVGEMRALGVLKARFHFGGALEEVILGPVPPPVDADVRDERPKRELTPLEAHKAREQAAEDAQKRITGPLGGFRG